MYVYGTTGGQLHDLTHANQFTANVPAHLFAAGLTAGAMVLGAPAGPALADLLPPPPPPGSTSPGNSGSSNGVDNGKKTGWTKPSNPHFTPGG